MLIENGEDILREFTVQNYQKTIAQVVSKVWYVLGLGHSNAIFIEGASSVILIDTLDTLERGQQLAGIIREKTGKEVKTIIYTHGHLDHRGGAGAFAASQPEVIAFESKLAPLAHTEVLWDIQMLRGMRQFGYSLSDEENISQGIGIREGIVYGEKHGFMPPTTIYREDKVVREIDGVQLEMVSVCGETEDQIMIWLPEKEVLCCGDNYYGCWPNLYAIRGGQYRNIALWLQSLKVIQSYQAQYLIPGHTPAVIGRDNVQEVLENFYGAIHYVFTETLLGMNQGKTMDQLAEEIRLPEKYTSLSYLGEHYGCVEWTVRAIYTAYLGWFDGNPTNLHPQSPTERAEKTIALMGGWDKVKKAAEDALQAGQYQWCIELCDFLLNSPGDHGAVSILKATGLEKLAEYETSANGRHYYLVCAQELRKQQ